MLNTQVNMKRDKKLRQTKQLEQIGRIDSLVKNVNKYFAPDPDNNNGTRKYALFSAKIEPVKLGISYAYQYTDIGMACHFMVCLVPHFLKRRSDSILFHLYVHIVKSSHWSTDVVNISVKTEPVLNAISRFQRRLILILAQYTLKRIKMGV